MQRICAVFLLASLMIVCAVSSPAATIYTGRAAWESQVSGITTQDFNALEGNEYQTLTLGNVTFDVPQVSSSDALWVSIPNDYAPIGIALVGNFGMTTIRGTFASPVTAVGADVTNLLLSDSIAINVEINGTWLNWSVPFTYPDAVFWGIVAGPGESIDGITFSPTSGGFVGIDNFSYGAGEGVGYIPEPATFGLMGFALLGLGAIRKFRS
ncbi:MAG: PEP-CTERM sorting domain-containing protein [Bryobacteraceae bacterium]|nr:PEP-CTERM sorting domain-containing protein [Bryobacteraceae bacterium]